ncbi:molybdate ABC transporter substrate-binding protein [Leucobacter massiliensis]|uniref:Molybdate ABC transporter substrate-binding protein n=1 Tax=Leucobacter massiliensis TaxID=1686285 RepID=A0A2S9QM66_9MICO|nr:molybdate ABC transporter substrate-binding protein [Leucobacter massiliensis]PRI10676.1 molybdate ABC transporter substrate-binding protein [Leucobacter massiliensis]
MSGPRSDARPRRALAAFALAATAALLPACAGQAGSATEAGGAAGSAADAGAVRGELSVSAAASLQPVFEPLAAEFTRQHPGVSFAQTFDGSSVLAAQIVGGAPADVFASADEANMRTVVEAGLAAGEPLAFATSELVIAVAPGNPLGIETLADLTAAGANGSSPVVVVCAAEVPCGAAARTLLERDGVALRPASEEQNVTAVLTRVRSGEADAGLVYASDVVRADGEVEGIPIPGSEAAAGSYLIVPLTGSDAPEAARAFAEFTRSEEARRLLDELGFGAA